MYHGEVQIQLYLGCVMSSRGVHEKQGTKITGLSFLQANRIVDEKRTYEKVEVFFVSRAHSEKMGFYSVLDANCCNEAGLCHHVIKCILKMTS